MSTHFLEDHPDYIHHLTEKKPLYPTAINIELTTYCNLKCIMCPKTSGIGRTPPDRTIDPEILDRIISEVLPHVARIDLVGDGEILIKPELVERILQAAKANHVLVNASTNAVLLDEKAARILVDNRLHDLNISMDAATPETFQAVRGAELTRVLDNIRRLNAIKKEQNVATPHLHFSLVGMKRNITELPGLVQLAHDYGVESVTLQAMGEFEPVKDESVYLRDKSLGKKWYLEAKSLGDELGVHIDLWPEDQFDSHGEPSQSPDTSHSGVQRKDCYFPWDVPYIATDGSIRPCCAMSPMGDLTGDRFRNIWEGTGYQTLRKAMKSTSPPEACKSCPGRGWHPPTVLESFLSIGQNDRQLGIGWFETETDDQGSYRWARERATFFLRHNDAGILSLDLQAATEEKATKQIKVTIDQETSVDLRLSPGIKQTFHVKLPRSSKSLYRVQLSGESWRPVDLMEENLDPRKLTVKFYGARITGRRVEVKFDNDISLTATELPDRYTVHGKSLPITFFWEFGSVPEEQLKMFVHLYRIDSSASPFAFFLADLRKVFFKTAVRFQEDIVLSPTSPGLKKVDVNVPIPSNQQSGRYHIIVGVYHAGGKRLPILDGQHPRYRNGLVIGKIHLEK